VKETRPIGRSSGKRVVVDVPPSKSYTQRALVAAALAAGESTILNPSRSTDAITMAAALRAFGIGIDDRGDRLVVRGCGGRIPPGDRTIDAGNAGTCLRFLTAFAALAPGTTVLTGDRAMLARPARALVDALRQAGVDASCDDGHPPVVVRGGGLRGGCVALDASVSSQFLSALLLSAPYAAGPFEVRLTGALSSAPYVAMTAAVMSAFGASCTDDGRSFRVDSPRGYAATEFPVEPDVSSATYFGSAAAITRGAVLIRGLRPGTLQGDIAFFDLLREMGCAVTAGSDGLEIAGAPLRGISADMNALPDSVPSLAVTAAFASSPTTITNVAHLRHKESDRLLALTRELARIGASASVEGDAMTITPGVPRGATIETYDDHRIAMSFAVAGLATDGVSIVDPACVVKSFPGFWTELDKFT
jgi:3-phosphoshikimate 1-carboxyvinyltransferase